MLILRAIAWLAASLMLLAGGAQAEGLGQAHVKAVLAAETRGAAPGATVYVALVQTIDPGWHTYWRNPGDAGQAPQIVWTLPAGWAAGDIVWPPPKPLPVGDLMDYGYEGQVVLPVAITVPAGARAGQTARIAAAVSMLVCADVCVPQDAHLTLDLPVTAGSPPPDPQWGPRIAAALAAAPKPSGLTAAYQHVGGTLRIAIAGPALAGKPAAGAYFFPYDSQLIKQSNPESVDLGAKGLTIAATIGPIFTDGPAPASVSGALVLSDGSAFEVTAAAGPAPAGSGGLGAPAPPVRLGLAMAALFAFLGGLILNLMPCVFPVLAMKAAALTARPHEATTARRQGLAFLVGVMATFLILAGAILAVRAGGEAVGWGAQLQSPMVVGALALIMLAAALDLSGVFEVGASLQGLGAGLAARADLIGALFTGALAVIVAAPCTAPFMGPALGYALTQPPAAGLTVFAALALGFAAPFTVLAFTPALLRRLPKPGRWMDILRRILALPMYGTAAWLFWVLAAQTDRRSLATVLAAAVLLCLAAAIYGGAQRRQAAGERAGWRLAGAGGVLALTVAVLVAAPFGPPPSGSAVAAVAADVPSEAWSPDRLASLRAAGKPVFVDFTAAWCVTCQVNEQTALRTAEAAAAFKRTGAVFLKADWTNRDAAIAEALADEGRVGVPLYLVYGADGSAPRVLPQLLTSGMVAEALDAAAKRPAAAAR